MNLIDPFQFREMFADARSFAVVGNAPTILDYENGEKIDSYDVVVRFNRATTDGMESKIGHRTEILVTNASNSRKMAPPPSETVNPRCLVTYISPEFSTNLQIDDFADWVEDLPILLTFGPDLFNLPAKFRTRPLTSGTYFLFMILRMLTVEKLFVTGFTMFGAGGGASGKYYQDNRSGVGTFHDLDLEAEVFADLLQQCGAELDLTPEVRAALGMEGGSNGNSAAGPATLRKRVAAGLAWRIMRVGTRLRRFAESR